MSGKQLVYCETKFVWAVSQLAPISSLSLLPTHINGIPAPYEDSIYIFRNDFILFPCHTVLCDRFDVCFREERLRVETTSLIFSQWNHRYLQWTDDDNRSYRSVCNMSFVSLSFVVIFIIKSSLMLKKQSMLVCFGMLPEKSTHHQTQRACTNHLVPNLRWIGPLASDGTVSGFRQKSSEFQLLSKHV